MKFTYQGRVYEYEQDRLPLTEAVLIKKLTGMGVRAFMDGMKEFDPDAFKILVFLALRRAGEVPVWDSIDFDVFDFMASFEGAPEEVPPGSATGTTQWPDDEPTSDLSPPSDSSHPLSTS